MLRKRSQFGICIYKAILLSFVPTGYADEHLEMPDWPVGGSVYSMPRQPIAASPATASADFDSEVKAPPAIRSPQVPNHAPDSDVVHATHREIVPSKTKHDERSLSQPPDRSIGAALQLKDSGGKANSIPKFGLPTGSVYTTVTALAIVVGLFLLCAWVLRRGGRGATRMLPPDVVNVVGRVQLTSRQNAELLRVGNKLVLVATTPTGAEPLTEITDTAEVNRLLGICQQFDKHSTTKAFEDVFRELSHAPGPDTLFGQESLSTSSAPVADAYRSHRREVGRA